MDTLHVLVIDESCAATELLEARLRNASVKVHHCIRAIDAVAMAVEHDPDYVFIDYALFSANPKTVRRKLNTDQRTRHIPVSFLLDSSAAWETNLFDGDYVALPFEEDRLERALGIA